jgi:hypothetical protein
VCRFGIEHEEEGRGKSEEGRGKREEERGKRKEGRGKREEGRGKRVAERRDWRATLTDFLQKPVRPNTLSFSRGAGELT